MYETASSLLFHFYLMVCLLRASKDEVGEVNWSQDGVKGAISHAQESGGKVLSFPLLSIVGGNSQQAWQRSGRILVSRCDLKC